MFDVTLTDTFQYVDIDYQHTENMIAMIILLHLLSDNQDRVAFFYWSSECDVLLPVVYKYEPYT